MSGSLHGCKVGSMRGFDEIDRLVSKYDLTMEREIVPNDIDTKYIININGVVNGHDIVANFIIPLAINTSFQSGGIITVDGVNADVQEYDMQWQSYRPMNIHTLDVFIRVLAEILKTGIPIIKRK